MGFINIDINDEEISEDIRRIAMRLQIKSVAPQTALSCLLGAYVEAYKKYEPDHNEECQDPDCKFVTVYKRAYEAIKFLRSGQEKEVVKELGKLNENF